MDNTRSEFKGTSGDWIFHEEDFKVRGSGDIEGMTVIANLSPKMDYSRGKNTQRANGQMIAACPKMFTALDILRAYFAAHAKTVTEQILFDVANDAINDALGNKKEYVIPDNTQ